MDITIKRIIAPLIAVLISASILMVVRGVAFTFLHRWAERKGQKKIEDIVRTALRTPSVYWCIAIAIHSGIGFSDLPERYVFYLSKAIHVLVVFSVTVAAANLAGKIFRDYIQQSRLSIPSTGLAHGMVKGTILIIGLLISLSVLGISVTPLITALGIGGLAVALALKDTLENLFAGIHILVEKSIRVGDLIKLETGQEGYVEDITWRTTWIRMAPNNMVIIPNSRLTQSIVTNFHLPGKQMALSIPVAVSYASDPEVVERVLMEEVKRAVGEIPGLLGDPGASAMLIPGFGENSLNFTLTCQVREFSEKDLVQHELRKRIIRRFKAEGIAIPFPQRMVHLRGERETGEDGRGEGHENV
ncbi:MAG TPA: mechanosensitive ion channel family protein [Thermodesulfovibrionales bacterium]|nr:mechanosensitive ion channel family protein [Thermodesulfovibrionales bacterium]